MLAITNIPALESFPLIKGLNYTGTVSMQQACIGWLWKEGEEEVAERWQRFYQESTEESGSELEEL